METSMSQDETTIDLVKRLRATGGNPALMDAAADEIERLRHREAHLLDIIRCYNSDDALFDCEKVVSDVIL
jgi:hypothetical protein